MTDDGSRVLKLEGAFNARDLGGLPAGGGRTIRRQRIFRTGHLHRLTTADIAVLHEVGVRTVCDLRSDNELEWTGTGPLFERGVVTHHHAPFLGPHSAAYDAMFPTDPDERWRFWMERGYEPMLEVAAPAIASLFALLAEEERYPLVIHCVAGKDRTGLLSALILRVLGVDDELIVADYAATAEIRPSPGTLRQMLGDYGRNIDDLPRDVWQSPPEVMRSTLRTLDERFGSTEHYLAEIGVFDEHVEALRSIML